LRRRDAFFARYPQIATSTLRAIFPAPRPCAPTKVVGDGRLGEDYGAGLSEREASLFRRPRMGAYRR